MNDTKTAPSSAAPVVIGILLLLGGAKIGAIVAHKIGPRDGSGLLPGMLIIPFGIIVAYIIIESCRRSPSKTTVAEKLPLEGVAEANLPPAERANRRLAIVFLFTVPLVAALGGWFVSDIHHMFGVLAFACLGTVFGILAYTLAQFGMLPRVPE